MRDFLISKLHGAANELYENLDRQLHVNDVVNRLTTASDLHPRDYVIRTMEDVFRKRASKNPGHLVTAEEFETVRQELWGLNPSSPVKEFFPDLVFKTKEAQKQERTYEYGDESVRSTSGAKNEQQLVNASRQAILSQLEAAGLAYAQTRFAKALYANYDADGNPEDGVMMFDANVITAAGDARFSIPVILEKGQILMPDSFGCNGMKYSLNKQGVSDFSMGLRGIATDNDVVPEYVYGESEIRDVPTENNVAEQIVGTAKQYVYDSFRAYGVNNCQIRLGAFEMNEDDGTGTIQFDVKLPFTTSQVRVPVNVDGLLVGTPHSFSCGEKEYELSHSGLKTYIADVHVSDTRRIAERIAGDAGPRDAIETVKTNHTFAISEKLAKDFSAFGATNPQISYVTQSSDKNKTTIAFMGTFGSKKGTCNIAIPITIQGSDVLQPSSFFGEDEQSYQFSSDGFSNYIKAKNDYAQSAQTGFYGEHEKVNLAKGEIDNESKIIARQHFEDKTREIGPREDAAVRIVSVLRDVLASEFLKIGAVNPQITFVKDTKKDSETILSFAAEFATRNGLRRAAIPVSISANGANKPTHFFGDDSQSYEFSQDGLASYADLAVPASELEAEITSKLNLVSYDKLRTFVKEALVAGDSIKLSAGLAAMTERFGEESAQNCFNDLTVQAQASAARQNSQCFGCPFFRSASDPQSRTSQDTCLKFQTRVAQVRFGGHHSQCRLDKAEIEEKFDGAIVQSQIKLT